MTIRTSDIQVNQVYPRINLIKLQNWNTYQWILFDTEDRQHIVDVATIYRMFRKGNHPELENLVKLCMEYYRGIKSTP